MKKIVLTSLSALMMSVAAAGAADTCRKCGDQYKVFFGARAGIAKIAYDDAFSGLIVSGLLFGDTNPDKTVRISFPEYDTTLRMECGMRFGEYKSIWNGGFTISGEKTMGKEADVMVGQHASMPAVAEMLVKDLKGSTSIFSATFDNYIRLNKSMENRLDLVIGVGLADIETNVKLYGVGLSLQSHAAALRAGLDLELTENISMTVGARMYVPVTGQVVDSVCTFTGGFKFLF